MQPDKTDWKIIDLLSTKHLPNNKVAQELGVSEGTVRRRIKLMQDSGIMKIKALLDPDVLKNKQLAIIMANVAETRLLDEKAAELSALKDVLSVALVSGRYDLMIEVLVESNRGLVRFLTESLSAIEGIAATETFITLKSYNKFI